MLTLPAKLAVSYANKAPWIAATPYSAKSPETGAKTKIVGIPAPTSSSDSKPCSAVSISFSLTFSDCTFLYQ
ncbi:MAG: hypothetical protein BWY38_02766 [Ignavibacteria bacterium ADurb.Bin266]|nr:MAG: hypothetical protein BWY38_02766 [Ignavibacteria bacterium ADurb.Bin266]